MYSTARQNRRDLVVVFCILDFIALHQMSAETSKIPKKKNKKKQACRSQRTLVLPLVLKIPKSKAVFFALMPEFEG